jgi:hypothetical protein
MAPDKPRRRRRALHHQLAAIQETLDACLVRIDKLGTAIEVNIKRMGAIQAELDHLRSMVSRT